jgi:uncharacterized membrane protein
MFTTVFLLLACAIVAGIGAPFIFRIVPPNPVYGIRTRKTMSSPEVWFEVNRIGGVALAAAAGITAIALMMYSGTWLKSWWAQLLAFAIPIVGALAFTLYHERKM